jgi:imidazoleglycerol-phosphate dehydratase
VHGAHLRAARRAQDLSGRPYLGFDVEIPSERIGAFDTQLVEHFFQSMVNTAGITMHVRKLSGKNSHHIVEATFKAFARSLRMATDYDARREGQIASSKGVLTQE